MYRGEDMSDVLNALAARAQHGDSSALDELVVEVRRAVLRYALAQRLSREDADDLAQEVCVAVLGVVPGWQETGRSMWGYVFTVARNKLTDAVRRQVKESSFGRRVHSDDANETAMAVPDSGPGPEEHVMASLGASRLEGLLAQLPATQREVLVMRAVVGLSGRETAEALNLSPGSVHVIQHRAVTRLRELLNDEGAVQR
jgi:RNA polymerase sigma-70 factor (ECF subfamily)